MSRLLPGVDGRRKPDCRGTYAALVGATAVIASYATFALRKRARERHGQVATGLVEDALIVSSALAAAHAPMPARLDA